MPLELLLAYAVLLLALAIVAAGALFLSSCVAVFILRYFGINPWGEDDD